jgi:hypothetical protein
MGPHHCFLRNMARRAIDSREEAAAAIATEAALPVT